MQLRNRSTLTPPNRLGQTLSSIPKKVIPTSDNQFVSLVNDIPGEKQISYSKRELELLAAKNSFDKKKSKSNNMKYCLILLNILVIVWCYYHLLYECSFVDYSNHSYWFIRPNPS